MKVSSIEDVSIAADLGAQVIIVRGDAAGGPRVLKSPLYDLPINEIVPLAAHELAQRALIQPNFNMPLLAAAGGIYSGHQIADCMMGGADAVVVGTFLAMSQESDMEQEEKKQV